MTTEKTIHEGRANYQKNIESVGGKLSLFEDRIMFTPHSFNVQKEVISINLKSVTGLEMGWTKLLGLIPLLPNALVISELDKEYRFTVFDRSVWLEKIKA
jgi:hypothetical protein